MAMAIWTGIILPVKNIPMNNIHLVWMQFYDGYQVSLKIKAFQHRVASTGVKHTWRMIHEWLSEIKWSGDYHPEWKFYISDQWN